MNKRLSRILSAILILCMIPATVITALARGKGVYGDGRDNQSLTNADGQYIPETIVVDGELNDTGWPESGFAYVDSNTGYWSTQTPTNTALKYKYQIRSDYDYLYVGASVTLPSGVGSATVTVYFKDAQETSNGYTDKLVFNIENGTVAQGSHEGVTLSAQGTNGGYAAESNLFEGTSSGNTYTLEFRNRLADTFASTDISNVTYYISVTVEGESLYHPKMALSDSANVPTFDYWPVKADGTSGGEYIATWLVDYNKNVIPSEITIDGKFDEAVWSSLTDFYANGSEDFYGYNNSMSDDKLITLGDVKVDYSSSKGAGSTEEPKFKYDVRVDGTYLYGAVKAYISDFEPYEIRWTENGTAKITRIIPAPDLYVYFYSDNDTVGALKTDNAISVKLDAYPETVIQIRSQTDSRSESLAVKDSYATYADINITESQIKNGVIAGINWQGSAIANSGFQGKRAALDGNLFTFEFKVKLDAIPTFDFDEDGDQDIVYGIILSDRLSIDGKAYRNDEEITINGRSYAWTGISDSIEEYGHYIVQKQIAAKTYFTAEDIAAAKSLDVASKDDYTDGNLAQEYWGDLTAADTYLDGRETTGSAGDSCVDRFAYKLTTDYEYLYGAALIKGEDPIFRVYLNRAREGDELSVSNVSVTGSKWGGSTNTDGSVLKDGTVSSYTVSPNYAEFTAWNECHITSPTITLDLGSVQEVRELRSYFHGGDIGASGLWGIYRPADIKISYSNDGVNFTDIESSLNVVTTLNDTYVHMKDSMPTNDKFNRYLYKSTLKKTVNARYIRITVTATGQFVWCSEIEAYTPPVFDQYYTIAIDDVQNELRVYYNNDKKTILSGASDINKFEARTTSTGLKLVEFRLSLRHLGITPSLAVDEDDPLFYYFVSAKKNDNNYGTLYHPKSASADGLPTNNNWGKDSGAATFTYGDMLGNVSVDGKLDETCWVGDNVEMIHVNATNGSWETAPTKGNTLDFDYRIYAGSNYLYGAAVIDTAAISSEKAYAYQNAAHTRFNLWIDNKDDEYNWLHDGNDKTNMCIDGSGVCYENYYYNIYLVDTPTSVSSASDGYYVCGGATPNWYCDKSTGENVGIDLPNYNWAMTTINGKTYVEFMIALDNFHNDPDKGFNYYVSVTNAYGTETDETSDDETLTLYYPQLPRTQTVGMPVTHYNDEPYSNTPIGNGALLYDSNEKDVADNVCALWTFWERVILSPVDTEKNTYKIEWLWHSQMIDTNTVKKVNGDDTNKALAAVPDLQSGWLAYALHYDSASVGYAKALGEEMQSWQIGDTVVLRDFAIDDIDPVSGTYGLVLAHAYNLNSVSSRENIITQSGRTVTFSDDYRCSYGVMNLSKLNRYSLSNATYTANIPTTTVWDGTNAGTIEKLTHFAPDVVEVDGLLKDSVWNNSDGWIKVQDNVNGSYQEASSKETGREYSYKLVTDGEYLYVAVKLGVNYGAATSPSVKLWLKSSEAATTFTHFYHISYNDDLAKKTVSAELPDASYDKADGFAYEGYREGITVDGSNVVYENTLLFAENTNVTTPNGGTTLNDAFNYGDSALFGYTEEIQENFAGMGEYYPVIKTTKTYLGKESGIMTSGTDGNGTVVEFKVALSEFGAVDEDDNFVGFEYFIQASFVDGGERKTLLYPVVNSEADSDNSYFDNNFPVWEWSSVTSAKVTAEDIRSGAIRMRNNCVPVVTLGAKISSSYTAKDGKTYEALRFGALYTEDYLRNWEATDKTTLKPEDANYNEMYTAPMNDYWDVADVGIVMLPTVMLEKDQKLTLETPDALALSANDIVGWINSAPDGWSNFADYENFVFYATLYGVPKDVKVSFCGYVDFYASTDTVSFYDVPIERSYDMVESVINWGPIGE